MACGECGELKGEREKLTVSGLQEQAESSPYLITSVIMSLAQLLQIRQ
jgi:hypothetical protein